MVPMRRSVAVLAGDGIGPEVVGEAVKVLEATGLSFDFHEALIGGCAFDATGDPLPDETLALCKQADAVLLGAVGGPKWDQVQPISKRPEVGGLLRLRSELNLFANVRPAKMHAALREACPLKDKQGDIDLVVVRELTGGIYFGKPRERQNAGNTAIDTCVYHRFEIERIAERAIAIARQRRHEIVSVDKANVLETSRLWREVVSEMATSNPDVKVTHMLVDNCAMQLIKSPASFDVILTENLFGDILSDEASVITGSLGLLPSASLSDARGESVFGLFEPVHGSAPDIAGSGKANPIAAILSAAMMLRYSFGENDAASRIEAAVDQALAHGLRTPDLSEPGATMVNTTEMGSAIASFV